jgi:hypothetical protein
MVSLTVTGSFVSKLYSSSNSSTVLVSTRSRLCSSVCFPGNKGSYCSERRFGFRVKAYDSSKNDSSSNNNNSGDAKPPNGTMVIVSISCSS